MANESEEVVPVVEKTRSKWIKRIKLLLGGSRILSLEVDDSELSELIDIAFEKMKPYITDTDYLTRQYARVISLEDDKVEEVLKVIPGSQLATSAVSYDELLFDFQAYSTGRINPLSVVKKSVTPDILIPFEYVAETKSLYLAEGYTTGAVTIEVSKSIEFEDVRDDRALQWMFQYSLALAKEVIGRIRSKAKSTNVPIELDGETLLNEASTEKQSLESSLATEQYGPAIILR